MLQTKNGPIGKSISTQVGDPERSVGSFGRQIPNATRPMLGNVTQWVAAAYKAAIAGVLGGNLASALLIRRPRAVVEYWQNCLFVWRMVAGQGLPQRQVHEILPVEDSGNLDILSTTGHFVLWDARFAKDVLYLALICRVLQPRTIFEIGTLDGYTALLFSLNSPPDATVYTLELPPDD